MNLKKDNENIGLGASLKTFFKNSDNYIQLIFIIFVSLLVVFLSNFNQLDSDYQVGTVSTKKFRADRDLTFIDNIATKKAKDAAASRAGEFFVYDYANIKSTENAIEEAFIFGRQLEPKNIESLVTLKERFQTFLPFAEQDWMALLEDSFSESLEKALIGIYIELTSNGIYSTDMPISFNTAIFVINKNGQYKKLNKNLLSIDELPSLIKGKLLAYPLTQDERTLANNLLQVLIKPNLKQDQDFASVYAEDVQPIYQTIKKGEILVRPGELITPDIMQKLDNFENQNWISLKKSAGLFLLLLVFFAVDFIMVRFGRTGFKDFPRKEQLFTSALLIFSLLLSFASGRLGEIFLENYNNIDGRAFYFLAPVPAVAMLATIFLGIRKALFVSLIASILGAIVSPVENLPFFIYLHNGCLASIWRLKNLNERAFFVRASIYVSLINLLTISALFLYEGVELGPHLIYSFTSAFIAGILSGILAGGLMPIVELLFGFNTHLKMLELAKLESPVLRELMLSAPGTYHHSVVVASMAEAAAESIGANPLLAKAGGYYHDIGKISKPEYFIENQSGNNPHDFLTPSMSALILVSHVKRGIEIAKANNLPQEIIDIIAQHHGDSLISFFYNKAMIEANGEKVDESFYCYPGPKPESKEAALVMMADICEAASRSLTEPNPAKIQDMTAQLVNKIFQDGQLSQCELTMKEISMAIESFNNILMGIYHKRPVYPKHHRKKV